jgi:hypothetical protein
MSKGRVNKQTMVEETSQQEKNRLTNANLPSRQNKWSEYYVHCRFSTLFVVNNFTDISQFNDMLMLEIKRSKMLK